MQNEGKCKYGSGCSFYHSDSEKRNLLDPLPNLPEGFVLPPVPESIRTKAKTNNTYDKSNSHTPKKNHHKSNPHQ